MLHCVVRDALQQVGDHVDAGPALVVAFDHVPGRLGDVGVGEHLVLGARVLLPARYRLQVHRGQFPSPHGVVEPLAKTAFLLGVADREPVLEQQDVVLDEHPLEGRALVKEALVLLVGAEAHDAFDTRAVVPGPVEQDDLPGRGQVLDVPLEVPLGPLALGRLRERDDTGDAGVEVLGDAFDGAALAGGVPAFEHHGDARPLGARPVLHDHQLLLQPEEFTLVDPPWQSPG